MLRAGPKDTGPGYPILGKLRRESLSFPDFAKDEPLVEPLYGSWEANTSHALGRSPVGVVRQRGENRIVVGNFGVMRVLRAGPEVTKVKEGDLCLLALSRTDSYGYVKLVHGYDAPGTVGVLA